MVDIFWIPIAGIFCGSFAIVAIYYILNEAKTKEREMEHLERMKELEIRQLELDKERKSSGEQS